jgi:RNA polymerase sigma factor (sigma-70 family)
VEPEPTDAELVVGARSGDVAALSVLVDRHRDEAHAAARRRVGDTNVAEDVVQEALLIAVTDLDRLREPERFGAWLAGIVRNLCRRHSRRDADWSWEALHGGRVVRELVDPDAGPEELALRGEAERSVAAAIGRLSDGQRDAVRMHYLDDLSYREAAAALGIDVGAVKARLHRARAALRPAFGAAPVRPEIEKETTVTTSIETVRMRVADVRRDPDEDRHVVLLEADDGRRLPIWIGPSEATAMAINARGVETLRPLTYALVASLVDALGGDVVEVVLTDLREGTYYAEIVVTGPQGKTHVDARPSDALNLALTAGAAISVARRVLEAEERERTSNRYPEDFPTAFPDDADAIVADLQAMWEAHMRELEAKRSGT